MNKNMGNTDKGIRIIIALILAGLFFTDTITGIYGAIAMVIAGVFITTSLIGSCPLYSVFGFSSCPLRKK